MLLEIVGFWTPEYLQAKIQTLRRFPNVPVLLAVAESTRTRAPALAAGAILFRSRLDPDAVLPRLDHFGRSGGAV